VTSARPPIPRPLARAVRVEAGHRCAIPTCRATSGLQIHHIDDWARVREHTFENLVLLCAVCHARITAGEIDRQSAVAYKANLSLLASRYGDLERRVLDRFVNRPDDSEVIVDAGHAILLDYLLGDGLLVYLGPANGALYAGVSDPPPPDDKLAVTDHYGPAKWGLTEPGRRFVEQLRHARQVQ
jgi:HNH endonuclease